MFTVEKSVVDEFVKQSGKWSPDREFRCPDSLVDRELPIPCVSGHPRRHARQGVWVSGHPISVSRHGSGKNSWITNSAHFLPISPSSTQFPPLSPLGFVPKPWVLIIWSLLRQIQPWGHVPWGKSINSWFSWFDLDFGGLAKSLKFL